MGKQHEVLAAEPERKRNAEAELESTRHIFSLADARMIGTIKRYEALTEDDPVMPGQETPLATTVAEQLGDIEKAWLPYIDISFQKEQTNTTAFADLVVDGEVMIKRMCVGSLLNLDDKLKKLRKLYAAIPTLDPGKVWEWDKANEVWVSRPPKTFRTKKTLKALTIGEESVKHPVQYETFTEDVVVGEWHTTVQSGMITEATKRRYLKRLDVLLLAVKQARMRANDIEVEDVKIAGILFDYINVPADN